MDGHGGEMAELELGTGHAPARTEANYVLTLNLDHSVGADH